MDFRGVGGKENLGYCGLDIRSFSWVLSILHMSCILKHRAVSLPTVLPSLSHLGVGDLLLEDRLPLPLYALTKLVMHGCKGSRHMPMCVLLKTTLKMCA